MARALDSRLRGRWFESRPFRNKVTTLINFVIEQHSMVAVQGAGAVMPFDWTGHRRSGVALAMRC